MKRLIIIVCFGSGSAFARPSANMFAVLTDASAIALASTSFQMQWCLMSMCFVLFEVMRLLQALPLHKCLHSFLWHRVGIGGHLSPIAESAPRFDMRGSPQRSMLLWLINAPLCTAWMSN
jgi:hypothetical protein